MHATAMFSPRPGSAAGFQVERSSVTANNEPPVLIGSKERGLAEAIARAERAEERLRSRLAELVWPAALCAIIGGFLAIVGLRLAGV